MSEKSVVAYDRGGAVIKEFDQAWRFCRAYAMGIYPRLNDEEIKQKTAELLVRFQHGRELGFPPGASMQAIYVVKGRPAMEGSGVLAMCRSAEHRSKFTVLPTMGCDVITDDAGKEIDLVGWCEFHRKGEAPCRTEFTFGEAKRLGLTQKSEPWRAMPRQMLQWRAVGRANKMYWSDITLGVGMTEELRDPDYPGVADRGVVQAERPHAAKLAPAGEVDPLLAALEADLVAVEEATVRAEKLADSLTQGVVDEPSGAVVTVESSIPKDAQGESAVKQGELPMVDDAPTKPSSLAGPAPTPAPVTCPECRLQTESPDQPACLSCGIVFEDYFKALADGDDIPF